MTRSRAGALLTASVAAAAAILASRSASAYVRYETQGGIGFFWGQASIPITAYPDDFVQPTMTTDQVVGAATAAASAWSSGQNACTYLNLVLGTAPGAAPPANPKDNRNTLIFRSTSWCALASDGTTCISDFASEALALTFDTANVNTGQIYDADIELNAVNYTWADVTLDPSLDVDMDLQNAITHEMGHMIGLDHTCYDSTSGIAQPYDAAGLPVPACPASAEVQATTMYPSADPGDTQKRTLAPDDIAGLCGIYPVDDPPPPPGTNLDGGCASCALAPTRTDRMGLAGLGLLAAILVHVRRARRGSRR